MGCSIHEITGSISTIIMLAIVMPGAYLLILSRKIKKDVDTARPKGRIMKTEEQIKEKLREIDPSKSPTFTPGRAYWNGWEEALKWVLFE